MLARTGHHADPAEKLDIPSNCSAAEAMDGFRAAWAWCAHLHRPSLYIVVGLHQPLSSRAH